MPGTPAISAANQYTPCVTDAARTIRLVVADDVLLVREGIQRVLDTYPDIDVVAAVGDLGALLDAVSEHRPDVVITDIRMPPDFSDEGIQAAARLYTDSPETGVVVLSQYAEPEYAVKLLERGSKRRAYLLKERVSEPDQLAGAVREVAAGGSVIDPRVVEILVSRAKPETDPLAGLTPRERQVLEQIAQGKSNAGVAAHLYLTERAVEKHINSLFAKLGVGNEPDVHRRVAAVLLYLSTIQP
ncbi:response regulator transcription factor [Phytoactinopolyspora halotolerans]|uniref:Response regulator transcription factor n=1 Tax=Phytoactinopolyspora halotolerans TaxID=1981512 RepID=A0A6L9S4K2_9ACTN|nr:response regulator transcription factor [Phytoactinopolyspora halotolerans]